MNNPVNHVDVTGLCPDLGLEPTACEKFAREVEKIIRLTREVMQSQTFLGVPRWSEQEIDWVTVQFLAEYYAGIRAVDFAGGIVNPLPRIYAVPVPNADRYPKGNLSDEEYGFKRDFYNNTHHYIGLLYYGYSLGEEITKDVLSPYLELWNAFTENRLPVRQCPPMDCAGAPTWQLWLWVIFPPQECRWVVVGPPEAQAAWFAPGGTLSDLRVAEIAAHHGALIREQGISLLPGLIRREVCEHLYYGAPGRR